jgi:hypothetical protein
MIAIKKARRTTMAFAAVITLTLFNVSTPIALAQKYTLTSLQTDVLSAPSINDSGHVVFHRTVVVDGEVHWVIFIHDGTSESALFDVTGAGFGAAVETPVINNHGVVAVVACGNRCLIRIDPDQGATVLATFDPVNIGLGDFREVNQFHPSMNDSGHVAVTVTRNDGTPAVVRLEGPGSTEIAAQSSALIGFSSASINNAGRVAFAVGVPQGTGDCPLGTSDCLVVYSGVGGDLTLEGIRPINGGSGFAPFIRQDGLVLDTGGAAPALIYTAQGGVVNTLVVGNEDPVLGAIHLQPAFNNVGGFVFGSRSLSADGDFGLFTGNDPTQHTVIRKGDTAFGLLVVDVSTGLHYLNKWPDCLPFTGRVGGQECLPISPGSGRSGR